MVARKSCVYIEHLLRFCTRFQFRFVRGVTFLPKKFAGPQEEARTHLPTDHVGPLIDQNREVAIRLTPLCEGRTDNRFRGRSDDERLGELRGWGRAHFAVSAD